MARHRWTLALILICLPILATVITAFRVRDLPKSEDSVKIDRKCDDCDVKFGYKFHSIKTESENFKKAGIPQADQKSENKVDVRDEDDLSISKVKTEFIQEYPSASKIKLDKSNKKGLKLNHEHSDDDDSNEISSLLKTSKTLDDKKSITKSTKAKDITLKVKKHEDNSNEDDNTEKQTVSSKLKFNIKKPDHNLKQTDTKEKILKSISRDDDNDKDNERVDDKFESKTILKNVEDNYGSHENSDDDNENDNNYDGDDNNDDDDDDDDDGVLSSLWETFSLLGLNIDPSLKPAEKKEKQSIPTIKTTSTHRHSKGDKNYTKDAVNINIEVTPKMKNIAKKVDLKSITNLKEPVSKSFPKKTIANKHHSFVNNGDDGYNDEKNDISDDDDEKETNKPKNTFSKTDKIVSTQTKTMKFDKKIDDNDNDDDDDDDDDYDDDDEEDDNDDSIKKRSLRNNKYKTAIKDRNKKVTSSTKIVSLIDNSDDDNDDEDDDSDDDDDSDNVQNQKNNKGKVISTPKKNEGKVRTPMKIDKPVGNRHDDDDDDEDDDDDDDDDDNNFVQKQSLDKSKKKSTIKETDKKVTTSKKVVKTVDNRIDDDDDDDDDEDDDDGDNDEDDDDENDNNNGGIQTPTNLKNVVKKKSDKAVEPTERSLGKSNKVIEKVAKIDEKRKVSEDTAKSENKKVNSAKQDTDIKVKKDNIEITKVASKNQTTVNLEIKKEDKKASKGTKPLEDKSDKKADKKDQAKDATKSKQKDSKAPHPSASNEKKDDHVDGLNIPNIKKEIKTQIRSNSEETKSDKTPKQKLIRNQEMSSSTESHLKHVTDALHRRNLLKSEFEDFYAFFPTFAPNFSRIHNPECRRHGQIVLRQLRGTKLWALNMLDATAKIPSGILQGNGIQLGDFDQCVGSRARVQLESGSVVKVQGKYCLARLDVKAEHPELETPVHLAQAKNLIRSRIDDPGHFVPRFSTLSWGVCVPAACNPEDVEVVIKDAIKHYQKTSGVIVRVKVDEQDCCIEEADWWKDWTELPTVLTLSLYGVVVLLVLVATLQDFFAKRSESEETNEKKEPNEAEGKDEEKDVGGAERSDSIISSFSLYYTIDKLVAPGTTDDISCIHGVRAIATIALLIAHKFLPVGVMPYTNRLRITEMASSPLWSWCRAGWMFTDCFLLLSGALTAHKTSNTDNGPRRLFSRYMRLTPALLAVVLFYAYIWDNISSGPMWGTFVTKNAEVCQGGWWWNMLYIQNYFGFEDMCAPQTHQLALDMQLTILGGILVWLMQVKQGIYRFILPAIHIVAAYSRYTTVRDHRLTMLAYHGVSVSQLYRTARLSYTSTLHRSTPYLVGLSLGLALKNPAEHGKVLLGIGWISSAALWCLVWWVGADSGSIQYRYNSSFAAQYAALAPIASALALAWVIYAVHSGGSSFLSRFLCCRPLVLISRLSYALYLTQFVVFITNVATVRTSSEFTLISLIDVQEISAILISSVILTVTFVIPMQSLHKIFIFSSKSKNTEEETKESEENSSVKEEKQDNQTQREDNNQIESPQLKIRPHLIAHREVLEEIPEVEVEYESQRDNEGLGEILEEEEEEMGEESIGNIEMDDDLEIIEEEQGGEDDEDETWIDRQQYIPRRSDSNEDDQEVDEWEWTANGNRNGAQSYRYSR